MKSIPAQSPNLATTLFDDFSLSFWTPSDVSFKLILIFFFLLSHWLNLILVLVWCVLLTYWFVGWGYCYSLSCLDSI